DARYAAFDKNGKYLYFTASTDVGPTTGWLDLSSFNRPVTRSVYVIVLRKDLASPIPYESDEEKEEKEVLKGGDGPAKAAPEKPAGKKDEKDKDKKEKGKKKPSAVQVDLEDIDQRIVALPIPARNYGGLVAGKTGTLFLPERPSGPAEARGGSVVHK